MTRCKSKKSRQHDDIKIGIIAIIAMISILSLISMTSKQAIEGAAPIKFTKKYSYKQKTMYPTLNLAAKRVDCTSEGIQKCMDYYHPWEYLSTSTTINYKQCVWYVQRACSKAPLFYPHPLS